MPNGNGHDVGLTWLLFAVLALSMWGTYGVWLHAGASAMNTGNDPNFRYKAYIFVGLAYFFVAILCPVVVMLLKGANWTFPAKGVWLSLGAGCVGALGAFFVLLGRRHERTGPDGVRVPSGVTTLHVTEHPLGKSERDGRQREDDEAGDDAGRVHTRGRSPADLDPRRSRAGRHAGVDGPARRARSVVDSSAAVQDGPSAP